MDTTTGCLRYSSKNNFQNETAKCLRKAGRFKYSFRKRLDELVKRFDKSLLESLGIVAQAFPSEVADARNYFTHWDSECGTPLITDLVLTNLVSRLKAFTRLVLLSHLGISPENVARRMLDNPYLYLPEGFPSIGPNFSTKHFKKAKPNGDTNLRRRTEFNHKLCLRISGIDAWLCSAKSLIF